MHLAQRTLMVIDPP